MSWIDFQILQPWNAANANRFNHNFTVSQLDATSPLQPLNAASSLTSAIQTLNRGIPSITNAMNALSQSLNQDIINMTAPLQGNMQRHINQQDAIPPGTFPVLQQEQFFIHLLSSDHATSFPQTELGDHLQHHVVQSDLFQYFISHPQDFMGLGNYAQLAADAPNMVNEQNTMAQEAASLMGNFPNGLNQNALIQLNNGQGDISNLIGFTPDQVLQAEQGQFGGNVGISAKDFIDTWARVASTSTDAPNLNILDFINASNTHQEMATIMNALSNDPQLTDTLVKSTASTFAGKYATMAQDEAWFAGNFNTIASSDGNLNSINPTDIVNFFNANVTGFNPNPNPSPIPSSNPNPGAINPDLVGSLQQIMNMVQTITQELQQLISGLTGGNLLNGALVGNAPP